MAMLRRTALGLAMALSGKIADLQLVLLTPPALT